MRYELKAKGKSESGTELRIYGDIGPSWDEDESNDARSVAASLEKLKGPLAVRINSFGGSVADGLAIYNALRRFPGRVTTYVDGVAYSIASLIAMAGEEIRIAANGMLMIHAPWGMAVGNAPEMREMAEILDKHADAMVVSYLRNGGPDESQIRAWLTDGSDHYFSAKEAVELGLVDVVDDAKPVFEIAAALRASGRTFTLPAASSRITTEIASMATTDETTGASAVTPTNQKPTEVMASHSRTVKAAVAQGVQAEAKRRSDISAVFADFYDADPLNPITALHDGCMDDVQCDELGARRKLLAMLAAQTADPILAPQQYSVQAQVKAPPQVSRYLGTDGGRVVAGLDQRDKRASGLVLALSVRAGIERDPTKIREAESGELIGMSLAQLMGDELRAAGLPYNGSAPQLVSNYLRHLPVLASGPSHGTDHLPAVLGNIAEKSMMDGWNTARETWGLWTRPGTLRNFQPATSVAMAFLDKLTRMVPSQEFEYGDLADQKQTRQLYQHGLRYGFPYEALINDDLSALAEAMSGWGEAASATIGDYVHSALFAAGSGGLGQVMTQDSTVLFHANHSNYVASGSGGVPSEATLNTARTAMMAQTDPNGRIIAVIPRYLIHGPALWATARKVLNSQDLQSVTVDGSTGATVLSGSINSARDMNLTPIEDYRIVASAPGVNTWVLAGERRTVEVAGLNGQPRPTAEMIPMGNIWGINYQLTCPFAVTVLDHRSMYLNFGA
jgi:ATP-dependent protease ClpP protease subunit